MLLCFGLPGTVVCGMNDLMGKQFSTQITLGYMPFLDCAPLVAAVEKGFAGDEGIVLRLVRETSWGQIGNRLAVGQFDGAHLPAPFALASSLALFPLSPSLIVPMTLSLGGGAVTVSPALADAMRALGPLRLADPLSAGQALKQVAQQRCSRGLLPLKFAVGHDYSSQAYHLRYWLAASGLHARFENSKTSEVSPCDIGIVALPSPLMADGLATGAIDGFCAAEPWSSVAVDRGVGCMIAATAAIWRGGPDKVLAMTRSWEERQQGELDALIRALYRAAQWCSHPGNTEELAGILAAPRYLGVDGSLLLPALTGDLITAPGQVEPFADFLLLDRKAANFPWVSQALWFYSQMMLCRQLSPSDESRQIVLDTYRPDLFRRALKPVFAPIPSASTKLEGALAAAQYVGATTGKLLLGPDMFFDSRVFDPECLDDYLAPAVIP